MKLATSTAELTPEVREAVQPGWRVMCSTADDPDTLFCLEVRRLAGDRFAGPLTWHPHAARVDLDEWVEFTGWQHVQASTRVTSTPAASAGRRARSD
jgi:hypothetical protein